MTHPDDKALAPFREGGRCERTECRLWVIRREPHHVVSKGRGGANRLDLPINLLSLCGDFDGGCHRILQGNVRKGCHLVGLREGLHSDFVEERLRLLVRAPKECQVCPSCRGEGTVKVVLLCKGGTFQRHHCNTCVGGGILLRGEPWHEPPRRHTFTTK